MLGVLFHDGLGGGYVRLHSVIGILMHLVSLEMFESFQ